MWFWWRGRTCNQAHIFAESYCWSRGADITMKDFSSFPDTRRYENWAHKIFSWNFLTIWRPILPVFPRAQSTWFLCWMPFTGYCRSAATAAHDLILVEVDGKCQPLAGISDKWSSVTGLHFPYLWNGFSIDPALQGLCSKLTSFLSVLGRHHRFLQNLFPLPGTWCPSPPLPLIDAYPFFRYQVRDHILRDKAHFPLLPLLPHFWGTVHSYKFILLCEIL